MPKITKKCEHTKAVWLHDTDKRVVELTCPRCDKILATKKMRPPCTDSPKQ